MCVQIIDFTPWPCCEEDISIWVLYQIYPTVCGMLSAWQKAKVFPAREKGLKFYLIRVLICVP